MVAPASPQPLSLLVETAARSLRHAAHRYHTATERTSDAEAQLYAAALEYSAAVLMDKAGTPPASWRAGR